VTYEILSTRVFTVKNPYSAQNAMYEFTDVMSKYRDSEISVIFDTEYYYDNPEYTEVIMKLVRKKR